MTQFAICYEPSDMAAIAAAIQDIRLPNAIRQRGKEYWDGGLSGWSTAPLGVFPGSDPNACTQCRVLIINPTHGGNLAGFRQLCIDTAASLGDAVSSYLIALAADMGGSDGAREPYP